MENHSLIDKYFGGTLTDQERIEFDRLMESDSAFLQEVEFQRNLQQVIEVEQKQEQKKVLESIEAKLSSKHGEVEIGRDSRSILSKRNWLVAASIALLACVGGWAILNGSSNKFSVEEMYAENFEPYRNVVMPIERGGMGDGITEDFIPKGFIAYEEADYQKAEELFSKAEKLGTSLPSISFYRGVCLLQMAKTDEAIKQFQTYLDSTDDQFEQQAHWYLGLSFLRNKQFEDARNALKPLADDASAFNSQRAIELIDTLKSK